MVNQADADRASHDSPRLHAATALRRRPPRSAFRRRLSRTSPRRSIDRDKEIAAARPASHDAHAACCVGAYRPAFGFRSRLVPRSRNTIGALSALGDTGTSPGISPRSSLLGPAPQPS
jgi:hypothetical protein